MVNDDMDYAAATLDASLGEQSHGAGSGVPIAPPDTLPDDEVGCADEAGADSREIDHETSSLESLTRER